VTQTEQDRATAKATRAGVGIAVAASLLISGLLAGCGVRGSLEMPKQAAQTTAPADSGQGRPENAAPKPHKDFVLDSLIR